MKIILLSGGAGKRLWPLSSSNRAKQYLPVLEKPAGGLESMLQRVWRQLGAANLQRDTRIATCRQQAEQLLGQAGCGAPLIIEPEQRDSFPAAALAAAYLYAIAGAALSETVVLVPVDAYVEDSFFEFIKGLPKLLRESKAELLMVGISPDCPNGQSSYIIPQHGGGQQPGQGFKVSSFKERPFEEEARKLIREGALWNSGIYAFRLNFMISMLMERGLPVHYDELYKQYLKLPKTSFEHEVVQAAGSRAAVHYEGSWKDLGSWKALSEEIAVARLDGQTQAEESRQNRLVNELGIPITVVGLDNIIVAASQDGILVANADSDTLISAKLQTMNEKPKYEEWRWGHSRIVDSAVLPTGQQAVTKRVFVAEGQNMSYQLHFRRSEVWTIIAGEGVLLLDDVCRHVSAGDVVQIPGAGQTQSARGDGCGAY